VAADRLSISVFLISLPPPFVTRRWALFTVGFSSIQSQRDEDRWHQSHEEERACPMWPENLTVRELPICSLLGSWYPSLSHSVRLENSEPCSLT
jgi:hypothetical protein